jgi:uncharacterized BrkB/YihY/UPF0761 family membrane protein
MKSLFDTLNIVYAEEEKRGFIKLNAISLTFTAAAVAFILVAIAVVVVSALTFLITIPFVRVPLQTMPAFIPAQQALGMKWVGSIPENNANDAS